MRKFTLLAVLLTVLTALGAQAKTKVACIGNSITYGMTIPDREHNSYPAQLQRMLGDEYEVGNFGRNGATLLRSGHNPYVSNPEYPAALDFKPDIAVIHLGTNDTDPRNWPNYSDQFVGDYLALIDTLRAVNPKVRIIIANMAPIGTHHSRFKSGTRQWRDDIRRMIPQVAELAGVELIDFAAPLLDRQNLIPDALHPTAEGAGLLADYVRGAITGRWGGLQLPAVYQSGMVLPRNRRFTLRGRDDAGTTVRVSINGKTSVAHTDGCGNWEANIAPLPAGGPYTMTVTNGKSTIKLTNILAGEVWLASGQSNMEFFLQNAADTPQNLVPDTLLRVLNMRPIIHTDAGQWDSISCSRINRLEHYVDAKWTGADDPTFSAVAWHFGRALVDSLQVPVGIICNAIGGSGTEAWIDIETLQHEIPDLLVNWTTNDYLQPWVRGRAIQNMGTQDFGARHSYEPSYLFATGIRPLAGFPIDGVIWYQGESNAHNVELHEQLLPMMVDSWRREFRNEQLPFIFAQISSIARPSWPAFRDSQRRLSHSIPYCGMAVTSDVGDSLDVHPRLKAPVGQRLARIALHDVYSRTDITPHGPEPVRAIAMPDGTLRLVMECGYGMKSADGEPLRTFEIAETEGEYKPARVEIKNDTIILSNNTMTTPRYARYGWQPFTRANLVNSDNLPASTFRIEAESTEGGLEYGVSGAFGGTVNGRPYMAGGCNFPYADPISVAPSAKCYYQGVYDLTSGKRVASLPQRIAYGASAATPQGLVMIGGEGCKQVWLFDGTKLSDLPSLPAAVDNAYAAAIDSKIYVVGGNYDGTPSRRVLAFDLDNPDGGWRQIATLPGSARVQPVAVATDGKLYVWGGFTPRQGKNAPQVHTDGACLDLATGKWHSLPAPVNPIDGLPLTLSGGVAAMVGNEIVAVGGVNHDIFLDAITNQAADYLLHPVEWYKFNGQVCRFDPATEKWSVGAHRTAEYARAGAAAAVVDDGATLLLIGGELKPRVRTPRVVAVEF